VGFFGNKVQSEIDAVEGKTPEEKKRKVQQVLDSYFKKPGDKPTPGMFADPAAMFA